MLLLDLEKLDKRSNNHCCDIFILYQSTERLFYFCFNRSYFFFQTGDELSKRAKFVLVTWVGPSVSVMKKAKMSTDKALMKDIIQV